MWPRFQLSGKSLASWLDENSALSDLEADIPISMHECLLRVGRPPTPGLEGIPRPSGGKELSGQLGVSCGNCRQMSSGISRNEKSGRGWG
jgi:hypothetical protein